MKAGMNPAASSLVVKGLGASSGRATGLVMQVDHVNPADSFPDGAILVARTTNPSLVRHMIKASAIVTEIGGTLCHTAIVAMELGIPCVVGAANACRLLTDGLAVEVNGDEGEVVVVDQAAQG